MSSHQPHDPARAGQGQHDPLAARALEMSHRLRTPLNAVLGFAELLERGEATPREAAEAIRRNGDELLRVIDLLLDACGKALGGERINAPAGTDAVSPHPARGAALAGRTVLLVEDGEDNRRLAAAFLRGAGAEVVLAENGRVALDMLVSMRDRGGPMPDVVLMDMHMPVMDGYTATSLLRGAGFTVPVVAVTADVAPGSRRRCLEVGCSEFIPKPVRASGLVGACAAWCGRPGGDGRRDPATAALPT